MLFDTYWALLGSLPMLPAWWSGRPRYVACIRADAKDHPEYPKPVQALSSNATGKKLMQEEVMESGKVKEATTPKIQHQEKSLSLRFPRKHTAYISNPAESHSSHAQSLSPSRTYSMLVE